MASTDNDTHTPQSAPRILINPPVFILSGIFVLLFVGFAAAMPETADSVFTSIQAWTIESTGWFYVLAVAGFLVFVVALAASSLGTIKLGRDHSSPDFTYTSWFAMLFSAGMGIGLMFFGVAEPIMHYVSPPVGDAATAEARSEEHTSE